MTQASIQKETKAGIIKKFGKSANDSGNPAVQIALITHRINELNQHFADHKLDHHSKQGLLRLVGQRRRLLGYIRDRNAPEYAKLIKELGLRK